MDFNTLVALDIRPAPLEFFLHLAPNLPRLLIKLADFVFCLLFEHVEAIFALNHCRFFHQELKLCEGRMSFVAAPSCLNLDHS